MKRLNTISLSFIVIYTMNMESTLSFYSALGMEFIEEQHGSSNLVHHAHACNLGSIVLEIYPYQATLLNPENKQKMGAESRFGFNVTSLEERLCNLEKLGIKSKLSSKVKNNEQRVSVTDPDGRVILLTEISSVD
ncbi:MAG: VOC family protein [Nostoc sp.]|uniref:VOC family protein n=1 Tax=Nostoc sp. TaxID=1180 RepID=UPI002FF7B0FE